jgi:hypothetical protein
MSTIVIDSLKEIVFHNGVLRIECMAAGPNGTLTPSGTLVIPGPVAGPVVHSLGKAIEELDKKLREQAAAKELVKN